MQLMIMKFDFTLSLLDNDHVCEQLILLRIRQLTILVILLRIDPNISQSFNLDL